MKMIKVTLFLFMFALLTGAGAQSKSYKIKLTGLEIKTDVNTPIFTDKIDNKSGVTPGKWGVIIAEFAVKFADIKVPKGSLDDGKWLDEVDFQWEFILKPEGVDDIHKLGKFSRSVKYAGIGEGKHKVCLFVNPVNMKRYFKGGSALKNVWVRVSMKVNGLKEKDFTTLLVKGKRPEASKLPRYHELFNTDRSKKLTNIVLRRDETPFRSIQYDVFSPIAVESKSGRSLSSK